jgi:hypothetical protein
VKLRVTASEDQADAERVLAGDVSAFEASCAGGKLRL